MSINYLNDQQLSQVPARINKGKIPLFYKEDTLQVGTDFTYETVATFGQNVPCSGYLKNLGAATPGTPLGFQFAFDEALNYIPFGTLLDNHEIDLSTLPPVYGIYVASLFGPTKFSLLLV